LLVILIDLLKLLEEQLKPKEELKQRRKKEELKGDLLVVCLVMKISFTKL